MNTHTTPIKVPRAGTKQAELVEMLSRKSGVTLTKASEVLAWQPHTTRATMTGLKKRGYIIERVDRASKDKLYLIRTDMDKA